EVAALRDLRLHRSCLMLALAGSACLRAEGPSVTLEAPGLWHVCAGARDEQATPGRSKRRGSSPVGKTGRMCWWVVPAAEPGPLPGLAAYLCWRADGMSDANEQAPRILDLPIGLDATGMRQEFDSLGTVEVPADHYWGAQTQRSLQHFNIGKDRMPKEVYHAYGYVKKAAAVVKTRAGRVAGGEGDLVRRRGQ